MISASDVINKKLREEEELPPLYYRISADYGRVETARSMSSPNTEDLFGTTMNICAKINSMAPQNGMVIGGDLYYIIKKSSSFFSDDHHIDCSSFDFKTAGQYSITGIKHQYPVYLVVMRKKSSKYDSNVLNPYKQILNEENPKLKTLPNQIHRRSVNVKTSDEFSKRNDANYDNHIQYYYQYDQKKEQQNHPHNIMLIDDEPDMLLTYKTFLSAESYNVEEFTNPQSALQHFAQINSSYYDLVIMDIRMPGLNGLQLYYRLKAINPNVKILFLSALDAANEMISILPDVKLDDVIRKPVEQEYFLKKVNAAIQ
jgi:CheY-like chemotaxis protein